MIPATIVQKYLHNPRYLCLHVRPSIPSYSWIAGQWLDFTAEELLKSPTPAVGGFSFCSPTGNGTFELCIQKTSHPVSSWLFQDSINVGDSVLIGKASGRCLTIHTDNLKSSSNLAPDAEGNTDTEYSSEQTRSPLIPIEEVVCLAGGTGITPLISIVRTLKQKTSATATIYHGIRHRETGLLFEKEIPPHHIFVSSEGRRMNFTELGKKHGPEASYYVCGPKPFMDAAIMALQEVGCSRIHYETWW